MGVLNATELLFEEWWRLYKEGEIVYLSDMIRGIGMGSVEKPMDVSQDGCNKHFWDEECDGCKDGVPPVQEETVKSEEPQEDTGMFSKEARKVLGWEHGLERFYELLVEIGRIHSKKNRDYTSIHPLENFFRVAMDVGITPEDVIEVMVATKSARIRSLRKRGVSPQNESLSDSYRDRSVYSLLGDAISEMSDEEQYALFERIATEEMFEEGEDGEA